MTVQDLINELNLVTNKDNNVYLYDLDKGLRNSIIIVDEMIDCVDLNFSDKN